MLMLNVTRINVLKCRSANWGDSRYMKEIFSDMQRYAGILFLDISAYN